ncbi:carboxymuconolactone decarboxylase family protein [Plantactinospora sp. BB1]|uniref:carboxymuconolactone decarboxylase family protein n=1 Tax=Plantactinospora sp. BB1 TaxID=2071627 RepID=UPI000D17D29B|nr:carboxymuconolactone decarboxylase family protein [Plantactinospora sp. BB1]AVT37182.1 carboxymuconolactone decarboxylase [Plantactinospora sp. BB1]
MVAGRVISSVVQRQVKYVRTVPPGRADGLVAAVYRQVTEEMRLVVPPVLLHSPAPEALAGYWMLMREPLLAGGAVDRLGKEAVAAAVSVANICPYCVDMHSIGIYDLATEEDAEAVAGDRVDEIADPRIRDLAAWGRTAHQPDEAVLPRPAFSSAERAELVGVVVGFHYLGRMVNVFLANFLLPPRLGPRARRRVKHGISLMLSASLREVQPAGRSLRLLPEAPLPPDAAWAAGQPEIAEAVARSFAAFDRAGERALSPAVRQLVDDRLRGWRGEEAGLSRQWCERLVAELPEADRAAGRLALLTAFASHQVDEDTVREFRLTEPRDSALVEATAWASYAAARRIGALHVADRVF